MVKKNFNLHSIVNNRRITETTDFEFLYQLQKSLLLALREQGRLTPMQHRHGEERLKQQRREQAMRKQEKL